MTKDEMLAKMKAPGDMRGTGCYGVIQILVTTRCDGGQCSNCTQMIPHRKKADMSLVNVAAALESVRDYPGIVGIMGGNPCLHPQFPEICRLTAEILPDMSRRGIWANRLNGHGSAVSRTFGYFNFNVHGSRAAADEMRRDVPRARVWGETDPSMHGGVMLDMSDIVPDESARRELIAGCDINQRWSPAVCEIDGQAVAFFCEVAAAWSAVTGDNCGMPVAPGWWRRPMAAFAEQAETCCHHCGVPLRLAGRADSEKTDDVSKSTAAMFGRRSRKAVLHSGIDAQSRELTDYQKLRG
jgi:hypothetical protein